jgi:hypothetical protein
VVDSLGWHPNIDDRFVLHFHRDSIISSINEVNKNHIIRYFNLSGQQIDKPSGICIRVVGTREPELILVN